MWAHLPRRGIARVRLLFRPPRGDLRLPTGGGDDEQGADRSRPTYHLALRRPSSGGRRGAGRPGCRVHATGPGRSPGCRAGPGRTVDQGRHRQPDGLVQGPGGVGGVDQGPPARVQDRACTSTGNLANSVAAHAARAGMESVVLIPHDLEKAKVTMTSVYGGRVFAVEGSYDDVNRL